jgi:hypothetical protein
LNVASGTVRVLSGGTFNNTDRTSKVTSLSIAAGAKLDLGTNSAIIDYTGPVGTLVDDVRQHLDTGRLTGTIAALLVALGYADNAVLSPVKTSFAGQSVDSSSLLIKYTWFGDSDLDGDVDVADLGSLATNWQTAQRLERRRLRLQRHGRCQRPGCACDELAGRRGQPAGSESGAGAGGVWAPRGERTRAVLHRIAAGDGHSSAAAPASLIHQARIVPATLQAGPSGPGLPAFPDPAVNDRLVVALASVM